MRSKVAALIDRDSPLDQIRSRRSVTVKSASVHLSPGEQTELDDILSHPADYVDDPAFAKKTAFKLLFEKAPDIPKPNTSWYHPVMEDLNVTRDMKSVVNVVLTAKQEQALFLQFNYTRFMASKIVEKIGDKSPTEKQAYELLKWHRQSEQLRDQIAQSNLALVLAMAKRVRHSDMDFADLISEGNMALLRAIDKFNVSRGFKFSTYACRAILKAFSRSGMKHSQYRQLFPTDFDPALERSDFQRKKFDGHELDCAGEVLEIVVTNRADLTEVERAVINHRFAINREQTTAPLTLEQVGKIVGLTKERVRQIQNKALDKIRGILENEYIDGFQNGEEEVEEAPKKKGKNKKKKKK